MEIVNFQKMDPGAYETAVFDVYLGPKWGISLKGFCLCKSKQGNFYIKSSSFKEKRAGAKTPYEQAVDLHSERGKDFCKQVLELLSPLLPQEAPQIVEPAYKQQECPF